MSFERRPVPTPKIIYGRSLPPIQPPRDDTKYRAFLLEGKPQRVVLDWWGEGFSVVLNSIKCLPNRTFDLNAKRWIVVLTSEIADWLEKSGFGASNQWETIPTPFDMPPRNLTETRPTQEDRMIATREPPKVKEFADWRTAMLDPSRLIKGLYSYQEDFVKFMQVRERGLLLDAMGTGKTVQALAWLKYGANFPALIVVNAPTKLQWEANWKRWLSDLRISDQVGIISGKKAAASALKRGYSYIINWDILSAWAPVLVKHGFTALVGDEVQAIGNPTTKRTKAFRALARKIGKVVCMSGTPARSKPMQLWTTLNLMDPVAFPNFMQYKMRYCNPKLGPFGYIFNGVSHVEELYERLTKLSLRRTKEDVMKDLPAKTVDVVPMEVDAEAMQEYAALENDYDGELRGLAQADKLATLFNSAYNVKRKSCLSWINDFLDSGEKLLIFAWHRAVVDDMFKEMEAYNPAKIYGGMSLKEREAACNKFITDDTCQVLVANVQSGGVGIDGFQKVCCTCAFVELSAVPNDHTQAEDRLHRGGQERPVTAYYLIAPGTVDADAARSLDTKANNLSRAVDGVSIAKINSLHGKMEKTIKV